MKRQDIIDVLRELANSARSVVYSWSGGDLAGAVRALDYDTDAAEAMLAEWDGIGADEEVGA